jgi:hypothetical protein
MPIAKLFASQKLEKKNTSCWRVQPEKNTQAAAVQLHS